jgi:hypothetical protein
MHVVVSMVRDPPERSVLTGESAEEDEQELERAARLERSVREQAMIAGRDAEELDGAGDDEHHDGDATRADEEHQSTREMQEDERHDKKKVSRGEPSYVHRS